MSKCLGQKSLASNNSSNEDSDYTVCAFFPTPPKQKKSKTIHYTAEVIIEIKDQDGVLTPIRVLLDTGTSHTIVLQKFVK